MSKQNFFKLIYLIPEYLMIYVILKKLYSGIDLLILGTSIFYIYLLVALLYTRPIKKNYILPFYVLPIIVALIFFPFDIERIGLITAFTLIMPFRHRILFDEKHFLKYEFLRFVIDSVFIIGISFLFGGGYLVYYAMILRVLMVIQWNSTISPYENADKGDFIFIALNLIVVLIVPYLSYIIQFLWYLFAGIFYARIAPYLVDFIAFLTSGFEKFMRVLEPGYYVKGGYRVTKEQIAVHLLGKWHADPKLYVLDQKKLHGMSYFNIFGVYTYIVGFLLVGLLLFLIGYIIYRKYYGHGAKDKHKYYKETEYVLKQEARKENIERLSSIRRMYRRLLALTAKKGFKYFKGCTIDNVNGYLTEKLDIDKDNLVSIKSMYETERYGKRLADESRFKEKIAAVYKAIKNIHLTTKQ